MQRFAGVVVVRENLVLLVCEPDYFTGEPRWTFPSGHVDDGEEPAGAASRELSEESGCRIDAGSLELIAIADVEQQGQLVSRSWNYTATTDEVALAPSDEAEEIVTEARWVERAEAVRLLRQSAHAPKVEPAVSFLTSGDRHLTWTFDLVDESTPVPTFRWNPPASGLLE